MTQPTTIEHAQRGEAVGNTARVDCAAPQLAAIQQRYEEARASIIDRPRAPLNWVHDPADPHPDTEAIDVDAVLPPVPHDATPPTEAMSAAAIRLAQRASDERAPWARPATGPADLLGLRRWWRALWTP